MVVREVFGVKRDIDIPEDRAFPLINEIIKDEQCNLSPTVQHGWLDSSYQGFKLHYRKFLPDKKNDDGTTPKPKAIIVFLHGLGGHSGRGHLLKDGRRFHMSLQSYRYVEQEGFALYALDALGMGLSEGTRKYWPCREVLVQDAMNFIRLVSSCHEPETPIFLSGLSFGASLALLVFKQNLLQNQQQSNNKEEEEEEMKLLPLDSLLLFCPFIHPPSLFLTFALRFLVCILWWITLLLPEKTSLFLQSPLKKKRKNIKTDGRRDPEVIRRILSDKLQVRDGKRPIRSNLTILQTIIASLSPHCWRLNSDKKEVLPPNICIIHGTQDHHVPPEWPQYFFRDKTNKKGNQTIQQPKQGEKKGEEEEDRELHIIPGAVHDLLGDPSANENMDIMIQWIHMRLAKLDDRKKRK